MTTRRLAAALVALGACATASDVSDRSAALERRLDPARRAYCPPEALANAMVEVAFARAASARGDGLDAASHLDRAEDLAALVETTRCAPTAPEPVPPTTPTAPAAPPDLDQDGIPDANDPDDDGDGANDTIDQCPTAAEDQDGVEDIDGCPEPN